MIVAAAVCPGAPLLVPGLAPRLAESVPDLLQRCGAAVATLGEADHIVTIAVGRAGAGTVVLAPGSVVSASSLARSDVPVIRDVLLPGGPDRPPRDRFTPTWGSPRPTATPAVGTIVASWLLRSVSPPVPVTAIELDPRQALADGRGGERPADGILGALPSLRDSRSHTGLLVIADGAACHGPDAPGAEDPASADFDEALCSALAVPDPAVLAAFCSDRAEQAIALRCENLPALAALAALAAPPPEAGTVDHYAAPFGVGYVVARWQWRSTD